MRIKEVLISNYQQDFYCTCRYGAILAYLQQDRPDLIQRIKGCIVDSGGDPELNPKVIIFGSQYSVSYLVTV